MKIRLAEHANGKGKFRFQDGMLLVEQRHAEWLAESQNVMVTVIRSASTGSPEILYLIGSREV